MTKPTGNVTFLFTDIEGSTKLAQLQHEKLPEAMEKHNSILTEAVTSFNGIVFKTVGDAFCCAFHNVQDAITAAVESQIKLNSADWNGAEIKVRMGIHSGNVEWHETDYMGYITLARSSRVMSAANGGQILVSNTVYEQLSKNIYDVNDEVIKINFDKTSLKFLLRDLGERRLKDLIQPMNLYQVVSDDLPSEFPPLKTLDARPNNLPIQLTSFIGREEVMKQLKNLYTKTRLLTITGSGGAGKTRLAMQTGADMIDEFDNGIFLIELAPVTDHALIAFTVMNSLGIKEESDKSPEESLTAFLINKKMLLILDNCEHLISHCAILAELLLKKCPELKIIATSREPLNCMGEQTYRLPSLSLPDVKAHNTPEQLSQFEAVRLFIERALSVNPEFRVNNENAPALAEICFQLDGIPLAIELAAARIKILSVEKICERLGSRFKLLTGGKRTAIPRQQTLRALIDWSYELLSKEEKILWNRLSVFSGGWTLEEAERICSDDIIDKSEVFDLLNSLTEKSIIIYNNEKDRFGILETIRQYADEKIKDTNEYEKFSEYHFNFFLELAESCSYKLRGSESESIIKIFETENGNLEKCLKWSLESHSKEDGLKLSAAMSLYWQNRGFITEGIYWLESVLKRNSENRNSLYCNVICQLGNFKRLNGDVDKARELIVESLRISRELGDKTSTAKSLVRLGVLEYNQGRFDESAVLYEESLEIYKETGNKNGYAIALNNLANVLSNQGNFSRAYELYEESLVSRRESGDLFGIAISLNNLGIIAYETGEFQKAKDLLQESLQLRYQTGNNEGIAISLMNLGNVSYNQGDYASASRFYKEGLDISIEIDEKSCIADSLYNLGKNSIEQNDLEKAIELFNESLEISRVIKSKNSIADILFSLGRVAFEKKEYEKTKKYYRESLELYIETGNRKDIVLNILRYAQMHVKDGNFKLSTLLLGFINREYLELKKIKLPLSDQNIYDKLSAALKEELAPEEFSDNFEKGKSLTLEETCQQAVSS